MEDLEIGFEHSVIQAPVKWYLIGQYCRTFPRVERRFESQTAFRWVVIHVATLGLRTYLLHHKRLLVRFPCDTVLN